MKIMRQLLPLVLMLFAVTGMAKENELITKELQVSTFDAIDAECVDVYVTVGAPTGILSVTASPKVMQNFSARVEDKELKITCLKKGSNISFKSLFKNDKRPVVRITVPSLREIDAELSSKVVVDKSLSVNNIEIACETSSSVKVPGIIATGAVELKSETSSAVNIDALSAYAVEARCETSSTLSIGSLKASVAELKAETASTIKVADINVETLEADAETASTIKAVAGRVKYGEFSAETASQVNFEGVNIAGGSSESDTAGKVKAKFGTR